MCNESNSQGMQMCNINKKKCTQMSKLNANYSRPTKKSHNLYLTIHRECKPKSTIYRGVHLRVEHKLTWKKE